MVQSEQKCERAASKDAGQRSLQKDLSWRCTQTSLV